MAVAFHVQTHKLSQLSVKTCTGRENRTVLIVNMAATRETFQSFHEPYHIPCTVPSTNTETFRFLSNSPSFLPRSTLIDTYRGEIYARTTWAAYHFAGATLPCLLCELPKTPPIIVILEDRSTSREIVPRKIYSKNLNKCLYKPQHSYLKGFRENQIS